MTAIGTLRSPRERSTRSGRRCSTREVSPNPAWIHGMHGGSLTRESIPYFIRALREEPFAYQGKLLGRLVADAAEYGFYAPVAGDPLRDLEPEVARNQRGGSWRHQIKISRCAARSSSSLGISP